MVLGRYFATTFCADHRDRRNFHPRVFSQLGAAVAGHCLLGLARIATSDRIEMERFIQIQNAPQPRARAQQRGGETPLPGQ